MKVHLYLKTFKILYTTLTDRRHTGSGSGWTYMIFQWFPVCQINLLNWYNLFLIWFYLWDFL